ncbi:FtsH protease activity modulator HflK [Verticiella sediminum]|uniref:Protein HflK n=1 Tax=Verticiella sediminum TaxID=1247510 RepID=A0A556ADT4_9BURK|nr:FtsH protease activity modulator HflK [Verticiella sediminum]TSH91054.1 FtsH protease activity modulator HflK [Verticiella sediminum]
MHLPFKLFNLNDPGWGRGNQGGSGGNEPPRKPQRGDNDGPPDLDELWRDFNNRLGALFGRKPKRRNPFDSGGGNNGGGNGGGFRPSSRGARVGAIAVVGGAVLLWLASGFFIIQEGQVGVITRFGQYNTTVPAGFQWHMPAPIEQVQVVDVSQLRTFEIGFRGNARSTVAEESLMLTDDQNIVDLQFVVQYRIRPDGARAYLFNDREPDQAVRQAAETAMREVIGRTPMDFVLYEGRTQIASDASALMQGIMDRYQTGILISTVAILNAQPPEQVQAAFDDAVRAGQDRERQINEGEAYANQVIPLASGTASRLIEQAEGYRVRVVNDAKGDAARFSQIQQAYANAPAITRERLYIDTMQQIFSQATKVLVDTPNGNNMLYLPLDKIAQQASTPGPVSGAGTGTGSLGATGSAQFNVNVPNPSLAGGNSPAQSDSRVTAPRAGAFSSRTLDRDSR